MDTEPEQPQPGQPGPSFTIYHNIMDRLEQPSVWTEQDERVSVAMHVLIFPLISNTPAGSSGTVQLCRRESWKRYPRKNDFRI